MSVAAKGKAPKRVRLQSVSTLLESAIPKPGLDVWKMNHVAEGATILARAGEPIDRMTGKELLAAMREAGVGADAARDEAADRGTDLHAALEDYMRTGRPPDPVGKVPVEQYGYWRAAGNWLLSVDIEPVAIEQLVADPTAGYAGRTDLRARVNGRLLTIDYTTSDKLAIYSTKVTQTMLYERAARVCGDEPAEGILIVSLAPDGRFRAYERAYRHETTQRLLDWLDEYRPIDSECASANRAEKVATTEQRASSTAPKVQRVEGDRSTYPGAMERTLERTLPDGGLITYEESPRGWTTQSGTRRAKDWRAYWWVPPVQAELPVARAA